MTWLMKQKEYICLPTKSYIVTFLGLIHNIQEIGKFVIFFFLSEILLYIKICIYQLLKL